MSRPALSWAWTAPTKDAAERLVLVCLADHHNSSTGRCFPSVRTLAEETQLEVRSIKRILRRLERRAVIFTQRGGGRWSNNYQLAGLSTPVTQGPRRGDPGAQKPRTRGDPGSPKQEREQEKNALARAAPSGRAAALENPTLALAAERARDFAAAASCEWCDEQGWLYRLDGTVARCSHRPPDSQPAQVISLGGRL